MVMGLGLSPHIYFHSISTLFFTDTTECRFKKLYGIWFRLTIAWDNKEQQESSLSGGGMYPRICMLQRGNIIFKASQSLK